MAGWLAVLVSAASGVAVTLAGVVTGGLITSRSQRRQWTRDQQAGSCATVIQESVRVQLALREWWRHGQRADWTAWNQALAMIWLVGTPDTIAEAKHMDRLFWLAGQRIRRDQGFDEETWDAARDEMETARLSFINAARRGVAANAARLEDVPVGRPTLAEILALRLQQLLLDKELTVEQVAEKLLHRDEDQPDRDQGPARQPARCA
jgi:hypothetical protein